MAIITRIKKLIKFTIMFSTKTILKYRSKYLDLNSQKMHRSKNNN